MTKAQTKKVPASTETKNNKAQAHYNKFLTVVKQLRSYSPARTQVIVSNEGKPFFTNGQFALQLKEVCMTEDEPLNEKVNLGMMKRAGTLVAGHHARGIYIGEVNVKEWLGVVDTFTVLDTPGQYVLNDKGKKVGETELSPKFDTVSSFVGIALEFGKEGILHVPDEETPSFHGSLKTSMKSARIGLTNRYLRNFLKLAKQLKDETVKVSVYDPNAGDGQTPTAILLETEHLQGLIMKRLLVNIEGYKR